MATAPSQTDGEATRQQTDGDGTAAEGDVAEWDSHCARDSGHTTRAECACCVQWREWRTRRTNGPAAATTVPAATAFAVKRTQRRRERRRRQPISERRFQRRQHERPSGAQHSACGGRMIPKDSAQLALRSRPKSRSVCEPADRLREGAEKSRRSRRSQLLLYWLRIVRQGGLV